jgi:hypothetical protein
MDRVCIIFPILPGKTDAAREFMRALETERKTDLARSNQSVGMTREVWFLATGPAGDQLIGYAEMADFNRVIAEVAESRDEFDTWYKRQLAEVTGVDMNNPPPDLQPLELLTSYAVEEAVRS